MIVIAICAVICGADSWVAVESFGRTKYRWLSRFLELPHGIPSHDTFSNVFGLIDSPQFESCFINWIRDVIEVTDGQVIAIDGKQLRRSHDASTNQAAIHIVSAWASSQWVALGQLKVADHSNEIPAIPQLLEVLAISGCIVTTDAMGCQLVARVGRCQSGDAVVSEGEGLVASAGAGVIASQLGDIRFHIIVIIKGCEQGGGGFLVL
jgi:predicted transposase YbfD/YdcC